MKHKQLPLILILLMLLLVACRGNGDPDGAGGDPLDLPLIATSATDATDEDAMTEEPDGESTDEAQDVDGDMDASEDDDGAMDDDADGVAEDDGDMADDAIDAEDADADAMDAENADGEADADTGDAMAESDDAGDEAADEVAMDDDSAETEMTEDLSGTTVYVVQSGDSLSEIAETFDVSSAALMAANEIENADAIFVGQPLVIPGVGDSADVDAVAEDDAAEEGEDSAENDDAPATDNEGEYTVQAGDTLSELAEEWGIPARALAVKNGISDQAGLFTGQVLLIPAADEIDALLEAPLPELIIQPGTYIVQPGDSLAGIANTYGIPLVDLASANNIVNYDTIYVGQTLVLP